MDKKQKSHNKYHQLRNENKQCFQYIVTVTLNLEKIKKIHFPFINKFYWEVIDSPSEKMIGKKIKKIIEKLLLMFCILKKEKLYLGYASKHNSNGEK